MMKASFLVVALFALLPEIASASTIEIAKRAASVTSTSDQFEANSSQDLIDLSAGTYLLTLAVGGSAGGMVRSWSILLDRTSGESLLGKIQLDKFFDETLPVTKSIEFTLSDARVFEWQSMVEAANASASYSTTISSVTAVPNPDAGEGVGALAVCATAVWMRRRRKDVLSAT